MRGIKREIDVTVKTEDGHEHHLVFDINQMPRSVGGAFLTAVGLFPTWAKVIIEVTKEPAR